VTTEEKKPATEEQTAQIRWDGSSMKTTYANVCNVSNKNWHPSQKDLVIELSDRVIINPFAAKRLAILLANTMAEYEKRFGSIDLEAAPESVTPQ
jgi:hypothetical protein